MHSYRLSSLPSYGKWFVGLFALLMLCVCLWAGWLYTVEKGTLAAIDRLPAVGQNGAADSGNTDSELLPDEEAVLAPEWDTLHAGKEGVIDTQSSRELPSESDIEQTEDKQLMTLGHLRHNLGLAHTHINGQTLLFFALGLVFLFTSVADRLKTIVYILFGLSVIVHNIGLSGTGFSSLFDDLLAVSGVIILVLIAYMSLMVLAELLKEPKGG